MREGNWVYIVNPYNDQATCVRPKSPTHDVGGCGTERQGLHVEEELGEDREGGWADDLGHGPVPHLESDQFQY